MTRSHTAILLLRSLVLAIVVSDKLASAIQTDGCCLCPNDCGTMTNSLPEASEQSSFATTVLYNLDNDEPTTCQSFAMQVFAHVLAETFQCQHIQQSLQASCCPPKEVRNEEELSSNPQDEQRQLTIAQHQGQTIPYSERELFFSHLLSGNNNNNNPISNFVSNLFNPSSYSNWGSSILSTNPLTNAFNSAATGCSVPVPNRIGCYVLPNRMARQVNVHRPTANGFSSNMVSVRCSEASVTGIGLSPHDQLYNVLMACVRFECCDCQQAHAAPVCRGNNHIADSNRPVGTWTVKQQGGW